ncbi:MAG: LacI family DNA-binding transcriptional regulator [Anaerolineae bacterium]|nr:LacI family DNA-binding transcriptional regulator [Anaerolineae bacterium]
MPIRLKDLAAELNLSVTTVSRALADYDDVSPRTRQRVRQAAEAMGYVPDITAQRLQGQRKNALGFIIPTFGPRFSDPFFSEILAGIGNETGRQGYDLLISTVAPGPQELEVYHRYVFGRRVDGLLAVRTRRQDQRLAFLIENNFPVVAFGRTELPLSFPWIDVDGAHGLHLVVDHLVQLGHRRIAYARPPEELMFDAERWRGFEDALAHYGVPIVADLIRHGDLTQASGFRLGGDLLDLAEPPTAVISGNDLMALGVMAAAQGRGMEVGRDLSVIGFDDVTSSEHAHPPLTTVRQPIYHIGELVAEMLIQIINGEAPEETGILLEPKLIVRDSSGQPL